MKKINYNRPYHSSRWEKIEIYRKLIHEALERRGIYGIIFSNAPAVNPQTCYEFDCYELLKFEDGKMLHATTRQEYPENPIIFTKEQYDGGFLNALDQQNRSTWADEFKNAKWYKWDDVEEQNQYSWDSLYYCICEAISECADEDSYYDEEENYDRGDAYSDDWIEDECCSDDEDFDFDDDDESDDEEE